MVDSEQAKRLSRYIPLIDGGQCCELYPAPRGLDHNAFDYLDFNATHLKVRNRQTDMEYCIPFELIEFISPGGPGAVVRLSRQMEVRGNVLL